MTVKDKPILDSIAAESPLPPDEAISLTPIPTPTPTSKHDSTVASVQVYHQCVDWHLVVSDRVYTTQVQLQVVWHGLEER